MQVRRHLRTWAALTLLLQSAWLFALVPKDCCDAHVPAAAACHEEVAPPPHCPMEAADGAACPMHHSTHSTEAPARGDCGMRGSCSGPMGALLALLSVKGILTDSPIQFVEARSVARALDGIEQIVTQFIPPDSPPPRA